LAAINPDVAFQTIFNATAAQARTSFRGIVADIEQNVVPTMASISHSLVIIGTRLANGTYTKDIADVEVAGQIEAAASVIIRFANAVLKAVQGVINALLAAVAGVVNGVLGVGLL
jgi:hypothetical protein